jgi:hypothetical protein
MTQQSIRDGFADLREDKAMLPLADAAKCRSEADWLVGINGTRAMTAFNSRDGGFFLADRVPADVLDSVQKRLHPDPLRAAEIGSTTSAGRRIAELWPELRLIVTWTCASAGIAAATWRRCAKPTNMTGIFKAVILIRGKPQPEWARSPDPFDLPQCFNLTSDSLCESAQ